MSYGDLRTLMDADVAVVGGGPAGMCAAIAAARAGLEVALVERWPMVGGQSTMSRVCIWHTSDREREVILGLTKELVERLEAYGGIERWHDFPASPETYYFNSEWMAVVWDDLIREHGIRTACYTPCVDAVADGRRLEAVVVGTKRGLELVRAPLFIDATGDADVAAFAGCRTTKGRESDGKVQGMTLVSSFAGIDPASNEELRATHPELLATMARLRDAGELPSFGGFHLAESRFMAWYGSLIACTSGDPLDPESITRAAMEARAKLPKFLELFRTECPGCEHADLRWTAPALGVRESRRVRGLYTFGAEDVHALRSFPDAVGHGFWGIDIHDPDGSGHTTWLDRSTHLGAGATYQIPYRMLVAADVDNLLVAGRCASATHEGMAALRIQSHCHIMGQAAGTAAAMAVDQGIQPAEVDTAGLQRRLLDAGVVIDEERVKDVRENPGEEAPQPGLM